MGRCHIQIYDLIQELAILLTIIKSIEASSHERLSLHCQYDIKNKKCGLGLIMF